MESFKIGVVGAGFVGGAILAAHPDARFYDPAKLDAGSVPKLEDLYDCDALFLCLPTPRNEETGECNTDIIDGTLNALARACYGGLVIGKSTAPPDIYEFYDETLRITYVPEFLRAVSANDDYQGAEYFIIGAKEFRDFAEAERVIMSAPCFNYAMGFAPSFYHATIREAVLIKYFTNAFLASKVTIFNEFRRVANAMDSNWEGIVKGLALDPRIGSDHTAVPGPDTLCGWGGACFPKDTAALRIMASQNGEMMPVLTQVCRSNITDRAQR